VCGDEIEPAVADLGVAQRVFFADLSTLPSSGAEYDLAHTIMGTMEPYTLVRVITGLNRTGGGHGGDACARVCTVYW
jgi:hypothetical protein